MGQSIEFPKSKGRSKHLVDRRLETGQNFTSQQNERDRDLKAKQAVRYAVRKRAYKNKTEGSKAQRKSDAGMKAAARRRLGY